MQEKKATEGSGKKPELYNYQDVLQAIGAVYTFLGESINKKAENNSAKAGKAIVYSVLSQINAGDYGTAITEYPKMFLPPVRKNGGEDEKEEIEKYVKSILTGKDIDEKIDDKVVDFLKEIIEKSEKGKKQGFFSKLTSGFSRLFKRKKNGRRIEMYRETPSFDLKKMVDTFTNYVERFNEAERPGSIKSKGWLGIPPLLLLSYFSDKQVKEGERLYVDFEKMVSGSEVFLILKEAFKPEKYIGIERKPSGRNVEGLVGVALGGNELARNIYIGLYNTLEDVVKNVYGKNKRVANRKKREVREKLLQEIQNLIPYIRGTRTTLYADEGNDIESIRKDLRAKIFLALVNTMKKTGLMEDIAERIYEMAIEDQRVNEKIENYKKLNRILQTFRNYVKSREEWKVLLKETLRRLGIKPKKDKDATRTWLEHIYGVSLDRTGNTIYLENSRQRVGGIITLLKQFYELSNHRNAYDAMICNNGIPFAKYASAGIEGVMEVSAGTESYLVGDRIELEGDKETLKSMIKVAIYANLLDAAFGKTEKSKKIEKLVSKPKVKKRKGTAEKKPQYTKPDRTAGRERVKEYSGTKAKEKVFVMYPAWPFTFLGPLHWIYRHIKETFNDFLYRIDGNSFVGYSRF